MAPPCSQALGASVLMPQKPGKGRVKASSRIPGGFWDLRDLI